MHKELMAQENAILSEDTALWEKVFMAADKGMTMQEDDKNYGEFLLDTIEGSKDQFTEDELKLLKEAAEKIREIENKLTTLRGIIQPHLGIILMQKVTVQQHLAIILTPKVTVQLHLDWRLTVRATIQLHPASFPTAKAIEQPHQIWLLTPGEKAISL